MIKVSLMAADETTIYQRYRKRTFLCACRMQFATRQTTCLYQRFKGIDSVNEGKIFKHQTTELV